MSDAPVRIYPSVLSAKINETLPFGQEVLIEAQHDAVSEVVVTRDADFCPIRVVCHVLQCGGVSTASAAADGLSPSAESISVIIALNSSSE